MINREHEPTIKYIKNHSHVTYEQMINNNSKLENVFTELKNKLTKTTQDLQYALTLLYSLGSITMICILVFIYLYSF